MDCKKQHFFFIPAGSSKQHHLISPQEKHVCKQGEGVNRHRKVTDRKTSSFKKLEYSNFLVLS